MKQKEKDELYLRVAFEVSGCSYAKRLNVGAVIVRGDRILSEGFNGTPKGFPNVCEDDHNHTLPYVLHAEANAIAKLTRSTESSEGATIYVTHAPCVECAKLIIQSGIKRVVYCNAYRIADGIDLLRRAGIKVEQIQKDYDEQED